MDMISIDSYTTARQDRSYLSDIGYGYRSQSARRETVEKFSTEEQRVSRSDEFHRNCSESDDKADHDNRTTTEPICKLSASESTDDSSIKKISFGQRSIEFIY
jgi:hypothetical protein